jgi:hypothetical protein
VTLDASSKVVSGRGGRIGVKDSPRLLTDMTIAAKPVVTLLERVINRLTVALYPT